MTVRRRMVEKLEVLSFPDRISMASAAADAIADRLRDLIDREGAARIVFGAAPSQEDTLANLVAAPGIDWSKVTAFHMDDYVDLPADADQRFANWLDARLFSRLPFGAVHRMAATGDPQAIARDYATLLNAAPLDIVVLGIGVNGHLAFNDPPADLDDPRDVAIVTLDRICRQQQVDDGAFDDIDAVPPRAITLTVPRMLRADRLFCVVPTEAKRDAVRAALHGPVTGDCPASALRSHPACTLYLEPDSDPDA
ncbi:MAG: 6-phosphogluconolactonase [Jannaschia sp.]